MRASLTLAVMATLVLQGAASAHPVRTIEDALDQAPQARGPLDDAIDRVTTALASLPEETLARGLAWNPRAVRPELASAIRFWCAYLIAQRLPGWPGGDALAPPDGVDVNDLVSLSPAILPSRPPIADRPALAKAMKAALGASGLSASDRLRVRQLEAIAGDSTALDDFIAGRSNDASLAMFAVEAQANQATLDRAIAILWADYLPLRGRAAGSPKPALALARRMRRAVDDRYARLLALATQKAAQGRGLTAADLALLDDLDHAGMEATQHVEAALFAWARDARPAISRPAMRGLFTGASWGLRMLDGDQAERLRFFTSSLASNDAERRALSAAALLWGRWPTPPAPSTFAPHLTEALLGLPRDRVLWFMKQDVPQATGGEVSEAYLRWLYRIIGGDDPSLVGTAIEQARRYAPGARHGTSLSDALRGLVTKRGRTVNAAWEPALRAAALALRYAYPPSPEDVADGAAIQSAVSALPPPPDGPPCGTGAVMAAEGMAQMRRDHRVAGRKLFGLGEPNEPRRIAETAAAMKSLLPR